MSTITAAMVKELRERTEAGMMECKKALVEANGDIELAIDNMRKSGQAKAAKKAGRVAAEGIILARRSEDGKYGILVEMNCETDFVAKDAGFLGLANQVADYALANRGVSIEDLKAKFEDDRAALVAKIGENMNIRRVQELSGDNIGVYLHGTKIGVLVAGNANEELLKQVAMHVTASRPEFLDPSDVSAEVVEKERQIQIDIAMQSGKSQEIAEKMVIGRMNKFTGEISLTTQAFVMDPAKTVGQLLTENNATVTAFIRFAVGEGIEKVESDFAAEVAAMTKA